MKSKHVLKRLLATALSAMMALTMLPHAAGSSTVYADPMTTEWEKTVTGLSSDGIKAPTLSSNSSVRWLGSYVWYGHYDGKPVRYRVLSPKTTEYGGTTMLLDCDSILYDSVYDETKNRPWIISDVESGLNGEQFLTAEGVFTFMEREAIAPSVKDQHDLVVGESKGNVDAWTQSNFGESTMLSWQRVFLLDVEEASNPEYGYIVASNVVTANRKKSYSNAYANWWLRSGASSTQGMAGFVAANGTFDTDWKGQMHGVSPAFNIDLSYVLFSTPVSGIAGQTGTEYKLTLIDEDIYLRQFAVSSPLVTAELNSDGLKVQAGYQLMTELIPDRLTVLVLDKEYTPGNTNGASILYFGVTECPTTDDGVKLTGKTNFSLPSKFTLSGWGSSYYVYLVAEDECGFYETDYASVPVLLTAPEEITYMIPDVTKQPKNVTIPVGDVATFTVEAKGSGTLTYQWQSRKDASSAWSNSGMPGAKTKTLKVNTSIGLHGWQFRCVVMLGNGKTKVSNPATLKLVPKITKQPKNATVPVGDIAEFTVAATGKGTLKYQWQSRKNASSAWSNSGMPGAKTAKLQVTTSTGLHGWQFRCVVTDGNKMSWGSNPATLTVVPKFTTQPKSVYADPGTQAKFTVVAIGKAPLSYQWQSRKNSSAEWSNSGQPGAKTATLQVDALAGLNGWQFRCVVTDGNGQKWGSAAATLFTKLGILKQPADKTASVGTTAKFTVEAYGKAPLKYQWQSRKNSSAQWSNSGQPGAKTATLQVGTLAGLNGWQFRCIITDAYGNTIPSKEATLTVK